MTVDEYEAVRLIDLEKCSQEECAERMDVARTTVQNIYEKAREKLADAIVNSKRLVIEGGEVYLCPKYNFSCGRGCGRECAYEKNLKGNKDIIDNFIEGDMKAMKIAVTYDDGRIFQHFGHTEVFKVYTVEDGAVKSSELVYAVNGGHSALADLLSGNKIDAVICGGIGGGAINALSGLGIKVYGGVEGNCDEAVNALVAGKLDFDPNVRCAHHDEHHGSGDSTCHGPDGCTHSCN
jgi:predicted Fe-Mo cluster-binding NifX family protein